MIDVQDIVLSVLLWYLISSKRILMEKIFWCEYFHVLNMEVNNLVNIVCSIKRDDGFASKYNDEDEYKGVYVMQFIKALFKWNNIVPS